MKRLHALAEADEQLDHQTLFNVIYYLLFTDCTDRAIWDHVVACTVRNPDTLPIFFYRPFKFARYFLAHHFPDMALRDFVRTQWLPERYFNQVQMEGRLSARDEMIELKGFLNQKVLAYPVCQVTFHNLVTLHFAWPDEKIAIQYHPKTHCKPFSHQPSAMLKLQAKIMRYENWEILDLSEFDFKEMDYQVKVDTLRQWLRSAKERQLENGIIEKEREYL